MSKSSLSTVVSSLVRASMGTTVPSTVTDDELDRHVAELILKEAKQKAERYLQDGVRAYLPDSEQDASLPRTNKRFLSAIIRNTDEHNRTILRAQAEAAQEAKAEREEQERRERRSRAAEATDAGRLRRLMGGASRRHDDEWDRSRDNKRRRRSRERREDDSYRRRRHRSRSVDSERRDRDSSRRRRQRRHGDSDYEGSSSKSHRKRSRSLESRYDRQNQKDDHNMERERIREEKGKGKETERSTSQEDTLLRSHTSKRTGEYLTHSETEDVLDSSTKTQEQILPRPSSPRAPDLPTQFRSRKPPASPTLSEEEDIERHRPRRRRHISPESLSKSKSSISALQTESRSSSPDIVSSKMDKYFEASYDPRLDTGPMTIPNVPSTGLIDGADFESWDAMLDIIRQRREDRAERKRLEKLGLLPDKKSKDKDVKIGKNSEAWTMEPGAGIMDIKYSKRGAVREWDMGKEGF